MTAPRDGGAAFPLVMDERKDYSYQEGMSLRDYFAARAMDSMIGETWSDANDQREISRRAYQMADFMLEARAV